MKRSLFVNVLLLIVLSATMFESLNAINAKEKIAVGVLAARNVRVFKINNQQHVARLSDPNMGRIWGTYASQIDHSIYAVDQSRSAVWVRTGDDPEGFMRELVAPGSGGLANPFYVIRRGDELFVASHDTDSVNRYDANTGAFLGQFVPSGSGGLDGTRGIRFYGGVLYVNSSLNARILKYDAVTGAFLGQFAQLPAGYVNCGMAIRENGDMCVGSAGNQGFRCFAIDGSVLAAPATFGRYCGAEFARDGKIYWARPDASSVERWNIDTLSGGFWVAASDARGIGIETDD